MKYPFLLFDADNTLFDFDAAERTAHRRLCETYGLAYSDEGYQLYHRCNAALWREFDRGECTKDFLLVERFRLRQLDWRLFGEIMGLSVPNMLQQAGGTAVVENPEI